MQSDGKIMQIRKVNEEGLSGCGFLVPLPDHRALQNSHISNPVWVGKGGGRGGVKDDDHSLEHMTYVLYNVDDLKLNNIVHDSSFCVQCFRCRV